jgi:RNA polymerase sigma-70 factor (ECF subfamily)
MNMSALSDKRLVERTRLGETDAYGELVRRYQTSVFNVCYRMLGERRQSEDLTQDAFLRGYLRLETFDENKPFGPWIRRVAANLCLNHLQRRRPSKFELDDERDQAVSKPSDGPEQHLVEKERARRVREAILALPPHQRSVIELRHYQGRSYKEIAEALNVSLSKVRSDLFRARQALARSLSKDVLLRTQPRP